MAYDEHLADRVRSLLGGESGLTERRMFGGLAMLIDGNMAVVVRGRGGLMVRMDPAARDKALAEPGASPTEMRGKEMRGWITVAPEAVAKAADLKRWVARGVATAKALPAK
jgi:TfoX/Sxy family transcriptional regulator of competence genes